MLQLVPLLKQFSGIKIQLMSILTVRVPPFDQTIFEYWNNPTA
jgi:hypothetical protein